MYYRNMLWISKEETLWQQKFTRILGSVCCSFDQTITNKVSDLTFSYRPLKYNNKSLEKTKVILYKEMTGDTANIKLNVLFTII